jgi:hypothetical protein
VGETRVDLVHLLEDLRDAYPGGLEETILTEIVVNALGSGASCIHFAPTLLGRRSPPSTTARECDGASSRAITTWRRAPRHAATASD